MTLFQIKKSTKAEKDTIVYAYCLDDNEYDYFLFDSIIFNGEVAIITLRKGRKEHIFQLYPYNDYFENRTMSCLLSLDEKTIIERSLQDIGKKIADYGNGIKTLRKEIKETKDAKEKSIKRKQELLQKLTIYKQENN